MPNDSIEDAIKQSSKRRVNACKFLQKGEISKTLMP